MNDQASIKTELKRILQHVSQSLLAAIDHIDHVDQEYDQACLSIANLTGKLVVTGLGKSGHIGRKIAATMSSIDIPALFIHTTEALHGDMGLINPGDTLLAISHSGEGDELLQLVSLMRNRGVFIISLTAHRQSMLAKFSDLVVTTGVITEACPYNLAPSTSTSISLAIGDAIALTAAQLRQFTPLQFAANHPGGHLGKRLLLTAADIMSTGEHLPVVHQSCPMTDALIEMSNKCLGMTAVVDQNDQLLGLITDGDIRRMMQNHRDNWQQLAARDVMCRSPKTIPPETTIENCVAFMRLHHINNVLVTRDLTYVGAFNWHTLSQRTLV